MQSNASGLSYATVVTALARARWFSLYVHVSGCQIDEVSLKRRIDRILLCPFFSFPSSFVALAPFCSQRLDERFLRRELFNGRSLVLFSWRLLFVRLSFVTITPSLC